MCGQVKASPSDTHAVCVTCLTGRVRVRVCIMGNECNNVPGRPCIYRGRPVYIYGVSHRGANWKRLPGGNKGITIRTNTHCISISLYRGANWKRRCVRRHRKCWARPTGRCYRGPCFPCTACSRCSRWEAASRAGGRVSEN